MSNDYKGEERRLERRVEKLEECSKRKVSIKIFIAVLLLVFGGSSIANISVINKLNQLEVKLAVMIEFTKKIEYHALKMQGFDLRISEMELREAARHPEYFQNRYNKKK